MNADAARALAQLGGGLGARALAGVLRRAVYGIAPDDPVVLAVAVALLLIAEHAVVARRGLAGIPMAFFTINGIVSCLLGLVGSIDLWRAATP